MLATGLLQDGIIPSPLLFLVFSFLSSDKQRSVYAPLFRSIPGRFICKRAASTVLDSILSSSLFHFSVLISLFQLPPPTPQPPTHTPPPPLLCPLWLNQCLSPVLLLLFWCLSRSVNERISGGGVNASESRLSPWHRRAQSQREGWDFTVLLRTLHWQML